MLKYYIYVVLSILFNISASYFLKKGAVDHNAINVNLIIGISIMGLAFVFYYLSLSKLNLGIVYPAITSISIVLITIMGNIFFQETIVFKQIIAILLILIGIFILFL